MQEKYIPLYKDIYTTFESNDEQGLVLSTTRLAIDIAQDIINSVTVNSLSAPAIVTACKFVIKTISETPGIESKKLDALTDIMLALVAQSTTVYSGAKRDKSFEEMMK